MEPIQKTLNYYRSKDVDEFWPKRKDLNIETTIIPAKNTWKFHSIYKARKDNASFRNWNTSVRDQNLEIKMQHPQWLDSKDKIAMSVGMVATESGSTTSSEVCMALVSFEGGADAYWVDFAALRTKRPESVECLRA